jgi:tetratricopeptide (TPR) repeat protein
MNPHQQRAEVLLQQGRYDRAAPELRQALAADPDNGFLHALLALCLIEMEQYEEATDEARTTIRLAPDVAFGHYLLAKVYLQRNWLDEAHRAIQEALRLNADHAPHHGLQAAIWLARRDWKAALDAANQGLALDPEDVQCNNLRALALVQLGRGDEASATLADNLARDPEDALSHANQGWALLHRGERQKALEHFREALRLQPGLEFARAGILEAMKSKNLLYRLMLRYFLWMSRLSGTAQWMVILGLYFGNRILNGLAAEHPAWRPWILPLTILYLVFALTTWIARPLFNSLLRLDRFGRHVLSRAEIVESNWVGAFVVLALAALVTWLATDNLFAQLGTIYFGLLLIPLSAVFKSSPGWPRRLMTLYTAGLAAAGLAWLPVGVFVSKELGFFLRDAFLWGSMLSWILGNVLISVNPRR